MDEQTRNRLIDIVGESNFSDRLIDRVSASADPAGRGARPDAVLWPTSTRQVSRIMAFARARGTRVVPRGAATNLTGAAQPLYSGLVVDFIRMNAILKVSIEDRLAVVQPGVVYGDLDRELGKLGFCFPPDPASARICTLGGNVATNAGGMRGAKYGATRDYVLGLEVVLPDGRVMKTGGMVSKSSSGYDLTGLFVGSEGTLGLFTEIILRICPRPLAKSTAVAVFERIEQAGNAIFGITQSGTTPSVLELLDEQCIRILIDQGGMTLPRAGAMILAETDGNSRAEADQQIDDVIDLFNKHHPISVERAETESDAERLWQARRSIGPAAVRLLPDGIVEDVAVPVSRIPEFIRETAALAERHQVVILNFGHAGDGNFHPQIMYDKRDSGHRRRAEKAAAEIYRLACRLGGTLTGEHGIGISKAPFMHLEHDPIAMRTMRELKQALDPDNILNPGKSGLVP